MVVLVHGEKSSPKLIFIFTIFYIHEAKKVFRLRNVVGNFFFSNLGRWQTFFLFSYRKIEEIFFLNFRRPSANFSEKFVTQTEDIIFLA